MPTLTSSSVTAIAAADPAVAVEYFEKLLAVETDCWDVHAALVAGQHDFVLLDVRSPEHFQREHIAGAVSLPYGRITERALAEYLSATLFVVYCDGPQCNGADRAAIRLARLGRRVKKMAGGVWGWKEDGFALASE